MILSDETALQAVRDERRCVWCGTVGPVDAAHIYSAGAGRVDHAWNLVPLCRRDHALNHSGEITKDDLLLLSAGRHGVMQSDITALVYKVRRLPTDAGARRPKKRRARSKAPSCPCGASVRARWQKLCLDCWTRQNAKERA